VSDRPVVPGGASGAGGTDGEGAPLIVPCAVEGVHVAHVDETSNEISVAHAISAETSSRDKTQIGSDTRV